MEKSLNVSYKWDKLLQLASEYALNDKLEGSGLIFQGRVLSTKWQKSQEI